MSTVKLSQQRSLLPWFVAIGAVAICALMCLLVGAFWWQQRQLTARLDARYENLDSRARDLAADAAPLVDRVGAGGQRNEQFRLRSRLSRDAVALRIIYEEMEDTLLMRMELQGRTGDRDKLETLRSRQKTMQQTEDWVSALQNSDVLPAGQ